MTYKIKLAEDGKSYNVVLDYGHPDIEDEVIESGMTHDEAVKCLDEAGPRYKIVRKYYDNKFPQEVIHTDLPLSEAKAHCADEESSGKRDGVPWFDVFYEE